MYFAIHNITHGTRLTTGLNPTRQGTLSTAEVFTAAPSDPKRGCIINLIKKHGDYGAKWLAISKSTLGVINLGLCLLH